MRSSLLCWRLRHCSPQPHAESSEDTNVLVILVLDKFYYDVLLRLDLEHLQDETHEGSQLSVVAVGSVEVVKLHGFVDNRVRCESKALLLPVRVLVNLRAENFLFSFSVVGCL